MNYEAMWIEFKHRLSLIEANHMINLFQSIANALIEIMDDIEKNHTRLSEENKNV
jgi:hypothetical protein